MPQPESNPSSLRLLNPPVVFLLLMLAGYSAFALNEKFQHQLGFSMGGIWFLDSYAVLAASDAVEAGLDPYLPNPLDPIQRPHAYSSWWFPLGKCGFTRTDNSLLGGIWVVAFFVMVMALLRPRSYGAAAWYALLMLSPPVLLALLRANNDLVIFFLIAAGVVAARTPTPWRLALFTLGLVLATGLKFYPIFAGLALLVVRPPRRMLTAAALTLLATGGALFSVWGDLHRLVISPTDCVHTFGAPILFHDLGWTPAASLGAGGFLLAAAALVCRWRGWYVGLDDERIDGRDRLAFACGAALLIGCFLSGISHAYRLIFVILLAPLLWGSAPGSVRTWSLTLAVVVVWLDGIYCLAANLPLAPVWLRETLAQLSCWRFVTQPVIWVAMALLGGSLWDVVFRAWADTRKSLLFPG